jgi:hypothetical protein
MYKNMSKKIASVIFKHCQTPNVNPLIKKDIKNDWSKMIIEYHHRILLSNIIVKYYCRIKLSVVFRIDYSRIKYLNTFTAK